MKIEIGESLCLSYLKHVRRCVIYQTNWKTSSCWKEEAKEENSQAIRDIFNKIAVHRAFEGILKKSKLDQFLKQAEIDALGMDQTGKMYAMDIAFHEEGLRYGSTDDAKARIMKKLVRSYLAVLSYFPFRGKKSCEIIFVSPRVIGERDESIRKYFNELIALLEPELKRDKVVFRYITNDEFKKVILDPTLKACKKNADTNELFLRSYKLLNLPYTEAKSTKKKASSSASSSLETGS